MAYSPATVGTGTIDSSDVQGNLDGMKKYVDGSMIASDIGAVGWCESKHIMRGHYDPITNQHTLASGIQAGRTSVSTEKSFVGDGPTGRSNSASENGKDFPNTTISFDLEAPANVMFQFYATPITPEFSGLNNPDETILRIVVDGVKVTTSKCSTFRRQHISTPPAQDWTAFSHQWSGFYVSKNLAAGKHSFGLQGFCKGRYTFLVNWSVSMEAYYL